MPNRIVLSSEQQVIVDSDLPAIVVSAGAGSGKTEVIAHRIERILSESQAEEFRVLAVSYTVKAAEALRTRLSTRLGGLHRRVDADTIHGFALSILRRYGTRIGLPKEPEILTRDEDRLELLQQWVSDQGGGELREPSELFSDIDLARARGSGNPPLLREWQAALNSRGALDYPEILVRARELLENGWVSKTLRRIYSHIVVDEAQNLTHSQYELIQGLIGRPQDPYVSVIMVGDERQSIVRFAGADPQLLTKFAKDYDAARFELRTNYRCARIIADLTGVVGRELNQHTIRRQEFVNFPAKGSIDLFDASDEQEQGRIVAEFVGRMLREGIGVEYLAPGESTSITAEDIAVLGRTAASLRSTVEALNDRAIKSAISSSEDDWTSTIAGRVVVDLISFMSAPHRTVRRRLSAACGVGVSDWQDTFELFSQTQDSALSRLQMVARATSPHDLIERLPEIPIEGPDWEADVELLKVTWEDFADSAESRSQTFGNFRQHIYRVQRGNDLTDGVRVLTVHKAQGREFKIVVVVGCTEGQFPDFRARTQSARMDELRAFYVAVSRASRVLLFTWPQFRPTRYGPRKSDPSSFLQFVREFA